MRNLRSRPPAPAPRRSTGGTTPLKPRAGGGLAGFTLIELTVVLCLLAIVLAIAIPRYGSLLVRGTMRSEARRLAALVRYLSDEASRSGVAHYLNFDVRKGEYWVSVRKGKGRPVELSTQLSRPHALPEGVFLKDVKIYGSGRKSSASKRVGFYARGESDEAIVHFSDPSADTFYSLHIKPYAGRCDMYDYYYKGYKERWFKAFQ